MEFLGKHLEFADWPEDLHRRFAKLATTEAAFAEFAGMYGLLGLEVTLRSAAANLLDDFLYNPDAFTEGTFDDLMERPEGQFFKTVGESWEAWATLHSQLNDQVAVWDALRRKDWSYLRQCVGHDDAGAYFVPPSGAAGQLDTRPRSLATPSVDLQKLAEEYVVGQVNTFIRLYTRPHFVSLASREIGIVPSNVLGVLYGLFAVELEGRIRRASRCRVCNEYFEPQHRSDQEYCSKAHKVKASGLRKLGVAI